MPKTNSQRKTVSQAANKMGTQSTGTKDSADMPQPHSVKGGSVSQTRIDPKRMGVTPKKTERLTNDPSTKKDIGGKLAPRKSIIIGG